MSAFLVTAIALLVAVVPCAIVVARGDVPDAVVAFGAIASNIVMVLALIAEGFNRSGEFELPLLSAVLIYGSGLVFVRFMERGL
ncbi:MAG TPA: monovalent cation/H+ antiporter complex subunit F [Streptosporangiaceae bacterium]|nr:monovalent cation/H+ antiporter complex subunit F [Streptosporangiaceae bacterium]